ncbi:MAG: C40 family peptidase [Acidobacteria bacterium]|nr:C40 family peptidase [Acidobacteriota bacterium]
MPRRRGARAGTPQPRSLALPGVIALIGVLSSAACASTGAVPAPFPRPGGAPAQSIGAPVHGTALVRTAMSFQGVPYRNGGGDPSGFDCSGLVAYVFARHGAVVPRTVSGQFSLGRGVRRGSIAPGDLVFFSTVAPGASHVGIAISGDQFVHAPATTGVVRVERLTSRYWSRRFVGARRLD